MRALCLLLGLLVALPAEAAPSLRRGRFKADYREALDRLARGDEQGALDAVVELENTTAESIGGPAIPRMRQAEAEVLERLAPTGVEALVPVILLHEQAYLRHREGSRPLLALHSRTLVVDLTRFYAEEGGEAARPLASRLLTSLAGHLQEASIDSVAAGLYAEAVKLEPDNPVALLALAYVREQRGDYSRALPLLEELVSLRPDDGEAVLRLGINRLRLGESAEGMGSLRSLLSPVQPDWIRSLAYQELARALADRNDADGAEELLQEAVRELPNDASLAIQLAFVADLEGSPVGLDLQDTLDRSAEQVSVAPRYRYSRMPTDALEEVRREIAGREAQRLAALDRALSGERASRAGL
ncbi:MAG: tetratricopeptide repeat protein [Thermoanaerobaculia bacterium]